MFEWADAIVYHADPDYSAAVVDQVDTDPYRLLPFRSPVSLKVFEWFERLAAARRAAPAGDVITALSTAAVDGVPLTDTELDTFFLLLLIAGNETTRHGLSHGIQAFAEHPEQLRRLQEDPGLLDTAVEEVLRWSCPQIHFRRTATAATELAGVPIAAGDRVVTWYLSANFDEREFPDPLQFDIGRRPNRHVTFGGGGPHLCLGQWLARLEVRTVLEELIPRLLGGRAGRPAPTGPVELHQRAQVAAAALAGPLIGRRLSRAAELSEQPGQLSGPATIRAASSSALTRLVVEATPVQAMSNAVPWSTDVRTIGRPRATFTPDSKSSSFDGMCPWSWYMHTTASQRSRRTAR